MNDIKPSSNQAPDQANRRAPGPIKRASSGGEKPARPQSPSSRVVKTIELKLHVPHLKIPGRLRGLYGRVARMSRKRKLILIGVIILVALSTTAVLGSRQSETASTAPESQNPLDQLQKGTPDYPTIIPAGKSIDDLGGWTRISPPEREPVYAYVDKIGSVPISVSQQPLPPSFKSDPASKVRDLALSQGADKPLQVGSNKVYVGTSKNGPQSVIYHTDTLLILIKSNAQVEDEEWKKYIQSLS